MTQSVNGPFTPADYAVVNVVSPHRWLPDPGLQPELGEAGAGRPRRRQCHRRRISAASHTPGSSSVPPREWDGRRCSAAGRSTDDHRTTATSSRTGATCRAVYYDASGNNSQQPKSDYAFCNQSEQGLPFLHEFKLSGSYQLPWEIQVNAALQSYSGPQLATRWNIGRTTRYSSNCLAPCVPGALVIPNMTPANYILDLVAPGTQYYDRLNQLDLGFRKIFRVRPVSVLRSGGFLQLPQRGLREEPEHDTRATSTSRRPARCATLQPRTMRLAMQMRF